MIKNITNIAGAEINVAGIAFKAIDTKDIDTSTQAMVNDVDLLVVAKLIIVN